MKTAQYDKLNMLREKIGLDEKEIEILKPFRDIFIDRKNDFSNCLYKTILDIPETAMFLMHFEPPGFLKKAWSHWFESLFKWDLSNEFLDFLWKIGMRHVEVHLDQRFSNLAFSMARQFCQQIIMSEIPSDRIGEISRVVDKLIDFCILVETSAYIDSNARCDMEIIRGIADRIRNKITVIGGNIKRLQQKIGDISDPTYEIFTSILVDSSACERMVVDIRNFSEVSQREVYTEKILLSYLINKAIEKIMAKETYKDVVVEKNFDQENTYILGDKMDMENLFYYVLENSFEALGQENRLVSISTHKEELLPNRIEIEIFNTGAPIRAEGMERLFAPFYSTKSGGTGFGLSIALLAVRKNYGKIIVQPVLEKGTRVLITLPTP
jgi:signal transduction histidine kinase